MSWTDDKSWSDRFIPAVKQIVGPMLLVDAPIERDRSEAVDLVVLRARDMTIGVRIRRPGYCARFPGQFTIRSGRSSGAETELSKIVKGWGDWLFYGHAANDDGKLAGWMLMDLHLLRAAFVVHDRLLRKPDGRVSGIQDNGDGTQFRWFKADALPRGVLIAHQKPSLMAVA